MRNMTAGDGEQSGDDSRKAQARSFSKSARKRQAASLQELGVRLSALPDRDIEALGLPEKLFAALRDLRRLPSHGAQVRQRQYIGKLMRSIDPEPVLAKLAAAKRRHDSEVRRFQEIERWRERLLTDPAAAEELRQAYPQTDRAALLRLLDRARKERLDGQPPAGARELFAYLRRLLA